MSTKLLRTFINEALQTSPIKVGTRVTLKNFAYALPMGATRQQRRQGAATMMKAGSLGKVVRLTGDMAVVRFIDNLVAPVNVKDLELDHFDDPSWSSDQ